MIMFAEIELKYEKRYFFSLIWGVVLAADLICVSFFLAGERNMRRYTVNDYASEAVAEFAAAKENADVSVVMLGNSRLRHAATIGFHPAEITELPDGRKLASIQFALNAARFQLYEWFSHRLLQAQPDIIVIQDSVISNSLGQGPTIIKAAEIVYDYYYKVLTGYDERKEWWDDRLWILKDCRFDYNERNALRRVEFMKKDFHQLAKENEDYQLSQSFIRQALARGIKVVVIRIVPYMEHFDHYGITLHTLDFHGLGYYPAPEQLLPDMHGRVEWVTYKSPDEPAHFCDDVHFNDEGRKAFMEWFLKNITKWERP